MITWMEPQKYKNTQFLRKKMYHKLLKWIIKMDFILILKY